MKSKISYKAMVKCKSLLDFDEDGEDGKEEKI